VVVAAVALCAMAAPVLPGVAAASARVSVVGDRRLSPRLRELLVRSPAVGRDVKVRLLLPARFRAGQSRRWPVLYLLHGCCDDETSWTRETDVERFTARDDLLVVMPDAGRAGWYSDWYNGGRGGPPAWETFHLTELLALMRDRYAADTSRMVVAGLSMGGFGTMSYAARHPDLFAAAASFSGALDTCQNDPVAQPAVELISRSQGNPPNAVWGDSIADEVRWRAHNPVDLAPNLRRTPLFVSTGNGVPGPYDDASSINASALEAGVNQQTMSFAHRLDALGIPYTGDFYGPGTHSWPYWQRELHRAMPMLLRALAHPRSAPPSFTFRSADRAFSVWGWSFRASWTDPAFTDVSIDGDTIALTGVGRVRITTPARYRPHARYRVGGLTMTADRAGRLTFTIDAGDTAEHYGPGPDSPGPRPRGPAVKVRVSRA